MDEPTDPSTPYQPSDHLRSGAPNERPTPSDFALRKIQAPTAAMRRSVKAAVANATRSKRGRKSKKGIARVVMSIWDFQQYCIEKGYPVIFKSAGDISDRAELSVRQTERLISELTASCVVFVACDARGGKRKSAGRQLDYGGLLVWLEVNDAKPTKWLRRQLLDLAEIRPTRCLPDTYRVKGEIIGKSQQNKDCEATKTPTYYLLQTSTYDGPERSSEERTGDEASLPKNEISNVTAQLAASPAVSGDSNPSQEIDARGRKHATSRIPTWPEFLKRQAKLGRSLHTIRAMAAHHGVNAPDLKQAEHRPVAYERARGGYATCAELTTIRSVFDKYENLSALDPDAWA